MCRALLIIYFLCCGRKVDQKKLKEQIQTLKKEKDDALAKISELQEKVSHKRND